MDGGSASAVDCETAAPLLSALLDGELAPAEQVVVERHLATCGDCRSTLTSLCATRAALATVREQSVAPASLHRRLGLALDAADRNRPRRLVDSRWLALAAALAAVAIGFGAWATLGRASTTLTAKALAAYRARPAGAPLLGVVTSDPVIAGQWVHTTTGQTHDVPDLRDQGYVLLGARAEPAVAHGAVSFVYAGESGVRLDCLVVVGHRALEGRPQGAAAIRLQVRADVSLAGWWDDNDSYVLAGPLPSADLAALAQQAARPR